MKKPIFLLTPDLEAYRQSRGLSNNFNILPFTISMSDDELVNNIYQFNYEEYRSSLITFMKSINSYDTGNASMEVSKWITNQMKFPNKL